MIKIDVKSFEKVKKWSFLMNSVPFLRGCFVCNSYAMGVSNENSDIDLFVVTKHGRLYTARFFMNFLFRIFGVRTYRENTAGKFCLSFFADEDNLNFTALAKRKDFYFAYWVYTLRPIVDRKMSDELKVSEKIIGRNFWARDLIGMTNSSLQLDMSFYREKFFFSTIFRKFFEILFVSFIGTFFETVFRKYQLRKIKRRLSRHGVVGEDVVLKRGLLKLHENDRRVAFRDAYLKEYGEEFNEENFISLLKSFRGK